jgi:cytochrome bd-type quinol oxidase subunit 2
MRCRESLREETRMKMTTTWAGVLGSLLITLMLGLAIVTVFGMTPAAQADACPVKHAATHTQSTPAPRAPATTSHHGYLIAVRMGWAA